MRSAPPALFRTVAIAEAFSWAGLLVGMLLKHVLKVTELGVQVFGPIHGAIFVAYLVSVLVVRRPLGWGPKTVLRGGGRVRPAVRHPGVRAPGPTAAAGSLPRPPAVHSLARDQHRLTG